MTDSRDTSDQTLRHRAVDQINMSAACHEHVGYVAPPGAMSYADTQLLIHELQVTQVELEMQNEELRRSADEGLHAEQYRAMIATELFGYWLVDVFGKLLDVNGTYCRMSGYSREELLQLSIPDLEDAESEDEIASHMKKMVESGVDHFESRHRHKDGWIYFVEISTTYLRNQQCCIVFIRDITERKGIEEELLEKNRFLNTLMDTIPIPIFFKDRSARYRGFNKSYEEFYGKSREDLLGKSVYDLAPGQLADVYHAKDEELFRNTGSQVYESEVRDASGGMHTVIFHKAAYMGQDGEVSGLIGAVLDITALRQYQETLRKSNEYLDNLFNCASAPIIVWDNNFTVTRTNKALEKIAGLLSGQIVGNHLGQLFPYEQMERSLERIIAANIGEHWESVELPIQNADGSSRIVLWNSATIFETDGTTPLATVAQGIDITERKLMEEQLVMAKAAAEAANHVKSTFLATMSHEIRTPLSALLGNIELLAESQLSPKQQEYLKSSQTASQMLLQVINDVLDFSKIEAGKLELVNETCSVSEMARHLVVAFAAAAEQKGLEFTHSLADGVPDHVFADCHRLYQIISNLLSNAIKFTDHGKVSLEIDTDHSLSGSESAPVLLFISVCDTGIGIPLNKQGTLFDSFTQVEEFATRHHAGTGLGLAICRSLAELMGGTISLASVPGEGSRFTLSLPVVVCRASKRVKTKRAEKTVATPRKILLADDEELGRMVTAALLERRGHRVTAVESGAALLEALQRERFDIVLSDISMPDMDGIEVVRIIRTGQRTGINSRIPMIALTAHAFTEDRERFLRYGFNDTASKPVNFEELLRRIDELCSVEVSK